MEHYSFGFKLVLAAFIGLWFAAFTMESLGAAEASSIACHTLYGEKMIRINENTVSISKWSENDRKISSISQAKSHPKHQGLRKSFYRDGDKYLIHIDNLNHFAEESDFMLIRNSKGHEMTYALRCHHITR